MLGEWFGNHRDGRGPDSVLGGDRSTSQQRRPDSLEKVFAHVRDVRGDKLGLIRVGNSKGPVVEVNWHALGQSNRAHAVCLLEIVANPPDGKPGLSLRSAWHRQARSCQSIGWKAKLRRPHPVEHYAAEDEKWYGDADLHKRRHTMHANRLSSPSAGILFQ